MIRALVCILALFVSTPVFSQQTVWETNNGTIRFHSDAPQELIRASSGKLQGLLDLSKRTFAFKLEIASFAGFNSPLQKEHFNENYMESDVYPNAIFVGKIIEDVDLSKDGSYTVRAKGKLTIHNVAQDRIIKAQVNAKDGKLYIQSDFTVLLADHDIKIPRIVYDKLSPEINVSVNATLVPKP